MQVVSLLRRGGPESLVYQDVPRPVPKSREVLVRVHASGVTPSELSWVPTWTTRGGTPRSFPVIPGHEFSGEVAVHS